VKRCCNQEKDSNNARKEALYEGRVPRDEKLPNKTPNRGCAEGQKTYNRRKLVEPVDELEYKNFEGAKHSVIVLFTNFS
jgi:hypothetical protein